MKAVRVALAMGIAILLPLLAQMTVQIYSVPPKYDEYVRYTEQPKNAEAREKANAEVRRKRELYERQSAAFNLQVFTLSFPLGILEIIAGFLLRKRSTFAAGLIFGGLSTVACGSYSSWETLPGWARYASLLFALSLIGFLAIVIDRKPESHPQSIE